MSGVTVGIARRRDGVSEADRKALLREYKESPRPAGIFCVRNIASGRCLVGSTPNLPGVINRQRFQLECGSHPDHDLQANWNESGPEAFDFEVLDRLEVQDRSPAALADDLVVLKDLWLERLAEAGTELYRQSRRG